MGRIPGTRRAGGCFFAAAAADVDSQPGPVRDRIAATGRAGIAAITADVETAQRRGEIRADIEVRQLAFELHAYAMEANWALLLLDDDGAGERARTAIDAALARVGTTQEGRIMKFVNHIEPVAPRRAGGAVAEVYAEARREFGRLPEPLAMLSPDEGLLTAGWATLRETLLVGQVPRGRKEAVAAAVAASLRCPWCVDAHTTMLYAAGQTDTAAAILAGTAPAAGDPNAPYVAWAAGTGTPAGPPAPFGPDVAAEYLGTAVQFHFIARLVLVLLDETFLPGGPRAQQLMRRAGGLVFARKVRAEHRPGRSTRRLEPRTLPDDLAWATPSEPIATAFAALSHHLDTAPHLPPPTRQVVRRVVGSWHGEPMPMSSRWTNEHTAELPADLHAPTRLALLTGLAPHQVTDDDVAAARSLLDTDAALVGALAWAAFTAARRIGTWIGAAAEGQVSRQNPTG